MNPTTLAIGNVVIGILIGISLCNLYKNICKLKTSKTSKKSGDKK